MNKLTLPVTILLASIILGGFYYASETNKQSSIERQQERELTAKQMEQQAVQDKEKVVADKKSACVIEAQQNAIDLNKAACLRGEYCLKGEGMYLVGQYNNAYTTCLQEQGIQ